MTTCHAPAGNRFLGAPLFRRRHVPRQQAAGHAQRRKRLAPRFADAERRGFPSGPSARPVHPRARTDTARRRQSASCRSPRRPAPSAPSRDPCAYPPRPHRPHVAGRSSAQRVVWQKIPQSIHPESPAASRACARPPPRPRPPERAAAPQTPAAPWPAASLFKIRREMRLTQRVEPIHQAASRHQRRRKRIRLIVFIQQQLHRVAQGLLPHARHGGIYRNDASRLFQRRVDDKQPALFANASAIERHLAGIEQLILHPRLVEPHAAHRAALVRNCRADPLHAAHAMQRGLPLHKAGEARLPSLGHLRRGKRMASYPCSLSAGSQPDRAQFQCRVAASALRRTGPKPLISASVRMMSSFS